MIQPAPTTNGARAVPSPAERTELASLYINAIIGLLGELPVADLEALFTAITDNIEGAAEADSLLP